MNSSVYSPHFSSKHHVVLRKQNGDEISYVSGTDTNVARGELLQRAKTEASSGDVIIVGPGIYDTRDLFKDGVNWHWIAGAKVIYTGSADAAVWDNSATGTTGSVTCKITGEGIFIHDGTHATGQQVSTLKIEVATSNIYFECVEIQHTPSSSSNQSSAVRVHGGTVILKCPYVFSSLGQGVWWSDGEMFFFGQDVVAVTTAIYSGADALPTSGDPWVSGYFWAKCNRAKSTAGQGAQLAGAANARSWVEIDECIGNSASAALFMGVGRNYAIVKKVTQSSTGPGVQFVGGENWLTVQKVVGGTGASGFPFNCTSGSSWVDCLHIEPAAGSATAMIRVSTGTHNLRVMDAISPSTTMNGVQISGGELRLNGARINAAASTSANPILKSGGTLILNNCILISNGVRDSISAATAQNVVAYACYANTAVDSDVTITITGGLTVDADVA